MCVWVGVGFFQNLVKSMINTNFLYKYFSCITVGFIRCIESSDTQYAPIFKLELIYILPALTVSRLHPLSWRRDSYQ